MRALADIYPDKAAHRWGPGVYMDPDRKTICGTPANMVFVVSVDDQDELPSGFHWCPHCGGRSAFLSDGQRG